MKSLLRLFFLGDNPRVTIGFFVLLALFIGAAVLIIIYGEPYSHG